MVKEAFIEAADSVFKNFKNKNEIMSGIKDLQLLRSTVTRCFEGMEENLAAELEEILVGVSVFQFNLMSQQTVDIAQLCIYIAQLCAFIRMVFKNMTVKEELLCILPHEGHTRGEDIFQAFMNYAYKTYSKHS